MCDETQADPVKVAVVAGSNHEIAVRLARLIQENERLRDALVEVVDQLDGLQEPVTLALFESDNIDYVSQAHYRAEVALGRRQAFPDYAEVAEWVGLHYGRNYDAESYEKRAEWCDRYMEAQSEAKVADRRASAIEPPQLIASVMAQDVVGEYDVPNAVPEWAWVEKNASFAHLRNANDGVWEFILNLSRDFEGDAGRFGPVIEEARALNVAYLLFHQGT